jgi:hypothetical protein
MVRILIWISRYLLAITFILSGFVKGIDPLGSAYKFGDYFMAFGMDFLVPFVVPFAFVLCAAELAIGLFLFFNVQNRVAVWGAFLFMLLFTPLTLFLAIFNPVTDCGCFGDAIVLTNWETFFKNIPFFAASLLLFVYRKRITSTFPKVQNIVIATLLLILSFLPSIHGYHNLPIMDFRPYSLGTNIPEAMSFPEDAPKDEYNTILIYEKDGVEKEFTQDNFPWQDSTWKFVDSKSILIKKGYSPPITDFALSDFYGWDLTDSVLNSPGYFLLAISHRLDDANHDAFAKFNELYYKAKEEGIGFYCITSSPPSEIDRFISNTGVAFPFLLADGIMLKTVVRANPGLVLLNNGTIIGKWHYNNFPETEFFQGNMVAKTMKLQRNRVETLWAYLLIVILLFAKGAVVMLDRKNQELE